MCSEFCSQKCAVVIYRMVSSIARSLHRICDWGLTNLALRMPLRYVNSPGSRSIAAVKNSPGMVHGWEDQSVIKNLIQNSMLISKPVHFVLRNRQLPPLYSFVVVDTSSAGAK